MNITWTVFLFALGACVGSFLNVVIYRLPRGQSVMFPKRSFCPYCGRTIHGFDNIPLLSWIVLRGKCRFCSSPISPRYRIVEAVTALMVAGLYICFFIVNIRSGAGEFTSAWPMFAAHAALLCGLLAASIVDVDLFIIPLEVMWVCMFVGLAAAAIRPHPFMPTISPELIAASIVATGGLLLAVLMQERGILQPSFVDADDKIALSQTDGDSPTVPADTVMISVNPGVNPRKEVLRELLFLTPAIVLGGAAFVLLRLVPAMGETWASLFDSAAHPILADHLSSFGSALFGLLVGGAWIWSVRILGTLGFGKEAMGLGDVYILAAVGAVGGWVVPTIAFFLAPFLGLIWTVGTILLRASARVRVLPYGPSLAVASVITILLYDKLVHWLAPMAIIAENS